MKTQTIKNAWHITAAETKPYVVIALLSVASIPATLLFGLFDTLAEMKRIPSDLAKEWRSLKHERDVFRGVVMRSRMDREKQKRGEQA